MSGIFTLPLAIGCVMNDNEWKINFSLTLECIMNIITMYLVYPTIRVWLHLAIGWGMNDNY